MNLKTNYIVELAPTLANHWYNVWKTRPDGKKGKFLGTFPSSTTFLQAYPTSIQLQQWIAENGWSESQKIKNEAGTSGTNVHNAIELLLRGEELNKDYYSLREWFCLWGYMNWHNEVHPEVIAVELPVFCKKYGYAGKLDAIYRIDGKIVLPDNKTSRNMHNSFWLQFASYAYAVEENSDIKIDETAALKLGASNKKGYTYVTKKTSWREDMKYFLSVKNTWEYENKYEKGDAPVLNLPSWLKLSL